MRPSRARGDGVTAMTESTNDGARTGRAATALVFGFGRRDISCFEPEMTMMGWGVLTNRVREVGVPLHARAVVIADAPGAGGGRVAYVAIDALIVTQGLWWGVLDALAQRPELGLGAHNTIIVATHSHSGPGGYGHHFWTNMSTPGFSQVVYDGLRDGIVGAIVDAFAALRPGRVSVARTTVPLGDGIAFNRSWFAYNKNVDVTPVTEARRDEATDRLMTVLRFREPDGALAGLVSWLGLHGTTVHADNVRMHPDHKGLAALALEARGLGVVFAQECCGDVSPNYRWDKRRRHTIGRYDDDLASAAHVAESQVRHVDAIAVDEEVPLHGPLEVAVRFVDFAATTAPAKYTPDGREQRTTSATIGLSMAEGTAEGPGPLRNVRALNRMLSRIAGLRGDPKVTFLEIGRGIDGRLAGLLPMAWTPPLDPVFRWVRDAVRRGAVHPGPWLPSVLPLHIVRIGGFALVAMPFETTTVSGRRLRATIEAALPGVSHVVVSPYANAYVGYLTTFEEYQVQHYEAGYTMFGQHSLAAVRGEVEALCAQLAPRVASTGSPPPRVDLEPMARMRYVAPWPV